jgi:hypothetical protein
MSTVGSMAIINNNIDTSRIDELEMMLDRFDFPESILSNRHTINL